MTQQIAMKWAVGAFWTLGVLWTVVESTVDGELRLRHPAIVVSAYFAFALWAIAVTQMMRTTPEEWDLRSGWFELFRLTWPLGSPDPYMAQLRVKQRHR